MAKKEAKVVKSICWGGGGCHGGCGIVLYVKNGELIKVEGDPENPYNEGRLCPRILALKQLVHHTDRLKYPMKRVGERGEGKWERVTWEEAYNIIVKRLNAIKSDYGPESVVFFRGTGRDITAWISVLAYAYGSPNIAFALSGSACYIPRVATTKIVFGGSIVTDASQFFPDRYDNPAWKLPECLIVWGTNALVSNANAFYGHWVTDCMARGTRLIVVDPRLIWLASRADVWLQLRPGTDAALALGMLNVIISEELYDMEFVDKWCYGFDKLKERVQAYPPEKVAGITWVPEEKIQKAARLYAKSKPATIEMGVAVDMNKESVPTIHAVETLWAITGNVDVPGGNIFARPPYGIKAQTFGWKVELLRPEQKQKMVGLKEFPLWRHMGFNTVQPDALMQQMLSGDPYPIRAVWVQTSNPLALTSTEPLEFYKVFKKLDFIVVVDLFMTPTAMLADLVLPAATLAERDSLTGKPGHPFGTINRALTVGESKPDAEINLEVARRLNPDAITWKNVEEMIDEILKPSGLTFEELRLKGVVYEPFEYEKYEKGLLRSDKKPGFNTPTGKIELYATSLEDWGLDPLPYFEEPPESPFSTPEVAREFPLILTTGMRSYAFFHSEHRQIPWLRELNRDPIVEIHPDTAMSLGIKDGDWVGIESRRGKCKQKAKLTVGIDPRVVGAQVGWWFPEKAGHEPSLFGVWESNVNLLLQYGLHGRSGLGSPLKSLLCKVFKTE